MARRSDHTRDELKQLILTRALEHLQTEPIQALSLRQLAKKVGYVPSSLLNVFGSYHYCLLAVSEIGIDRLYAICLQAQSEHQNAQQQVLAMALAYYEFAAAQTNLWRLMMSLTLPEGEEIPAHHAQKIEQLFVLLESSLTRLAASDRSDCHNTSRMLWASVQGITQLSLDDKLFSHASHTANNATKKTDPLQPAAETGKQLITHLITNFLNSWSQNATSTC